MLGENVALSGGVIVTGDLFVPGLPAIRINGNARYSGTIDGTGSTSPSNYQVTLSGNATVRHVICRTDAVALPVLQTPAAPSGTRRVTLRNAGQSPGDFSSLRDLTLDGTFGQLTMPAGNYGDVTISGNSGITLGVAGATQPSSYAFQRLTLNGPAQLQVVGPVVVTTLVTALASNGTIGSPAFPSWLTLNVHSGDVTLDGSGSVYGYLSAPSSKVTINGNGKLVGGLACDRLVLNGNSLLRLVAPPVNLPPQISLVAPPNGAAFFAPASVTLAANATDPDGSVAKVEFFRGLVKLGEGIVAPYRLTLNALEAGSYTFVARATDNLGVSTDSSAVSIAITGNRPPAVSLTAPANGAMFTAPASLSLQASASDSDGVITRVEFYQGTTKIGEDLYAPYETPLNGLPIGTYQLMARAFDSLGAYTDSAVVTIAVQAPNQPPSVALVAPPSGVGFTAPASLTLVATATDLDGTIAKVEFYQGATKLGEDTSAPYELAVADLPSGSYSFSARALDNVNATTTSESISVTVTSPNLAPTVAVTTPAEGTIFTVPATVLLTATASDLDGSITKVEFFHGLTKLGEVASAPFEFMWAGVPPGAYSLTARAYDNAGASTVSAARSFVVQIGIPYYTGFEAGDGYVLGSLANQNGWSADGPVTVGDAAPFRGVRSLIIAPSVPAARATHTFPLIAGQTVAFVDIFAKPAAGSEPGAAVFMGTESPRIAVVQSGTTGELYVFNGNGVGGGSWTPSGFSFGLSASGESAEWLRLTLREDFVTKRWDLFVNGRLIACDLGFGDNAVAGLTHFLITGHATVASLVDDFFVGFENPLFVDMDKDGMDDAWEIRNGLDPTANDRNRDSDGDGVSAVGEYRAGTSPADFFNGVIPQIEPLNGDGPGPQDELAMVVVRPDGTPWPNAPAVFEITSGDRRISANRGGPAFGRNLEVRTDSNGVARVYLEALEP